MADVTAWPRRGDVVPGSAGVTVLGPLGQGGFGHVHAATDAAGRALAIKLVPLGPDADREVAMARVVGSTPGVMQLRAAGIWRSHVVTVMPRATSFLADHISRPSGRVDAHIRVVLHDVLATLVRWSARAPALAHRDIHPGNIARIGGRWVLADLGIASIGRPAPDDPHLDRMTPEYAAPERWLGPAGGPPGDIYSIGNLIHAMATGSAPALMSGRDRRVPLDAPWFRTSSPWASIARRCVAIDPAERPTAATLLREVRGS